MGPIFGKNWPVFALYFLKSVKYQVFWGFAWYILWRYMKNHQKPSLKPFFAPENHYLDHFLPYFCNINLYWKGPISAIPSRTQTRISRARNWILTFRKKRWLRIEKFFHINSTCIFDPWPPPYRLKNWNQLFAHGFSKHIS